MEFWVKQAGFEIRRKLRMTPDASWIEVAPPGTQSCLVLYPKPLMANWHELKPSIVFECDDIAATYATMTNGLPFTQRPMNMPWGPFAKDHDYPHRRRGRHGGTCRAPRTTGAVGR